MQDVTEWSSVTARPQRSVLPRTNGVRLTGTEAGEQRGLNVRSTLSGLSLLQVRFRPCPYPRGIEVSSAPRVMMTVARAGHLPHAAN